MRVALVHDFLIQYGGAERVLEAFLGIWPNAPVYTLVADRRLVAERFAHVDIRTSFLARLPAPPPLRHQWWLPFYPQAIESFDTTGYDVVVSDSSAFAKGVITRPPTRHLSYIHTPTRYLWQPEDAATLLRPVPALFRPIVRRVLARQKNWDYHAAQRPEVMIANSAEVAVRIERFYQRRAAAIIYPPVDTSRFALAQSTEEYWVFVGRLETYKAPDLAVAAATQLNLPLKVVGTGRMLPALTAQAGPTVEFLGWQSDAVAAQILERARGLIFPCREDAGIVPLEAAAAGRPVLALAAGGALETVVPGVTGEFFPEPTVESLAAALSKFQPARYNPKKIRAHAEKFDIKIFQDKIKKIVSDQFKKRKTKVQVKSEK